MYRIIITDYSGESTFGTEDTLEKAEEKAKELCSGSFNCRGDLYSCGVDITDENYNLIKPVQMPRKRNGDIDHGIKIVRRKQKGGEYERL